MLGNALTIRSSALLFVSVSLRILVNLIVMTLLVPRSRHISSLHNVWFLLLLVLKTKVLFGQHKHLSQLEPIFYKTDACPNILLNSVILSPYRAIFRSLARQYLMKKPSSPVVLHLCFVVLSFEFLCIQTVESLHIANIILEFFFHHHCLLPLPSLIGWIILFRGFL